jgi:hypothetical protein
MADPEVSFKDAAGMIPSVYYDLIARVCAGLPFVLFLFWDWMKGKDVNDVTLAIVALLASYLTDFFSNPFRPLLIFSSILPDCETSRKCFTTLPRTHTGYMNATRRRGRRW